LWPSEKRVVLCVVCGVSMRCVTRRRGVTCACAWDYCWTDSVTHTDKIRMHTRVMQCHVCNKVDVIERTRAERRAGYLQSMQSINDGWTWSKRKKTIVWGLCTAIHSPAIHHLMCPRWVVISIIGCSAASSNSGDVLSSSIMASLTLSLRISTFCSCDISVTSMPSSPS